MEYLRFNYPTNTLSSPVIAVNNLPGTGFQYGTPTSTGSNTNTGVLSYNFTLASQTPGKVIAPHGFDIMTIEWNIISTSGLTDLANKLQWRNPSTSSNPKLALVTSTLTSGCPSGCTLVFTTTPDLNPLANLQPGCTALTSPLANAVNVPVSSNISWNTSANATGYRLNIGTSPGGTQILNNFDVGNVSTYNLPANLPFSTVIYVKVIPYDAIKNASFCGEESFTTAPQSPACVSITSPVNASTNVQTSTTLIWQSAATASGYFLTVGTASNNGNIINKLNVGNVTAYNLVGLPSGSVVYVSVVPYNAGGEATGCQEINFQTAPAAISFNAKVFLSQVNSTTRLMDDQLRSLWNFSITDPYSALQANPRFVHVNNPTTASISAAVLNNIGNDAIVDWVFLELRQGSGGSTTVVATRSALVQRDGDIVSTDGISPLLWNGVTPGQYYISIKHRNHFGFRTLNPYNLGASPLNLNFTDGSVAMGGGYNVVEKVPGLYTMVPGDANNDGSVDAVDTVIFESENGNFDDYNLRADYNMDASVDAIDSILWILYNGLFEAID